jgi:hypothetical protein
MTARIDEVDASAAPSAVTKPFSVRELIEPLRRCEPANLLFLAFSTQTSDPIRTVVTVWPSLAAWIVKAFISRHPWAAARDIALSWRPDETASPWGAG